MKCIRNFCIAWCFMMICSSANAQAAYEDEPVTAETLIELQSGESRTFAMSALYSQATAGGFALIWQTLNDQHIASFQLEAGENKKELRIIKTIAPAKGPQPSNRYQLDFNIAALPVEKTYFRIKANFADGKYLYGDLTVVSMKKN